MFYVLDNDSLSCVFGTIYFPVVGLFYHSLINVFHKAQVLHFNEVQLINFLLALSLVLYLKKLSPYPVSSFLDTFLYYHQDLKVLHFTL